MEYTVGDWKKGIWISGIALALMLPMGLGVSRFYLVFAALAGIGLLVSLIGLSGAQKKITHHREAARSFEVKVQPDSSKARW